jgi:hypothetical protein
MRSIFRAGLIALTVFPVPIMASRAQQPPQPPNCAAAPVCALKEGRGRPIECVSGGADAAQFLNVGECAARAVRDQYEASLA